jgi:hypothetical protein
MAEQQNSRFVVRMHKFVIPRDPEDREETDQEILLLAGLTWRTYEPSADVRPSSLTLITLHHTCQPWLFDSGCVYYKTLSFIPLDCSG